jgi:hypothetical protein
VDPQPRPEADPGAEGPFIYYLFALSGPATALSRCDVSGHRNTSEPSFR